MRPQKGIYEMATEKERMKEWLRRSAEEIISLKQDTNLTDEGRLNFIRQSYKVISVLTLVAENKAYMLGIAPPNLTNKE